MSKRNRKQLFYQIGSLLLAGLMVFGAVYVTLQFFI
jgi:hypothetical protein